jgi:hypothetical protein
MLTMRLPNAASARVDRDKVVKYLLSHDHPDGAPKARFFERCGFDRSEWEVLAVALREHGQANPVAKTLATDYGMRYVVDGPLRTPGGGEPIIRSV